MQINYFIRILVLLFGTTASILGATRVAAHGGVVFGDDLCVININFMQAHFTVFQPESRASEEFCESIPDVTRSVFVMEYLHTMLPDMRIDFRIIEDEQSLGRYADWDDVQAIEDLDAVTVHYDPPRIEPGGYYRSSYDFTSPGDYIGIVTATHPIEPRNYNAVFYFRVGGPDYGTWPLFALLLVVLQAAYWFGTGGYTRFKARRVNTDAVR